jgi:hypothetical protein
MNYTPEDYTCMLASIRERILLQDFKKMYNTFKIIKVSKVESKCKWDAVILSGGVQYITECKVRDKLKGWDRWILQQDKFEAITGLTNSIQGIDLNMKGFYINFFRDGAVVWEINNEQGLEFFKRDSKTTTAYASGRKLKDCAYLLNEDGMIFHYKNDIVKSTEKAKVIFEWLFPEVPIPNDGIWASPEECLTKFKR